MDIRGKKIFVGLSGGVDSAVSAMLLQRAGARVTGVFIKGWYPEGISCTWADERRDAMRVAAHLHIPFMTLDASAEYKESVIDYMLSEYKEGRTPNPDIMCNKDIKFGVFYQFSMAHGADAIATGHYLSGEKDQRYFLWAVPKKIFSETLFPVGHMQKSEVRALAQKYALPVATKSDSQGVCFLGSISVQDFLIQQYGTTQGYAYTESDEFIGEHKGAMLYTLGERFSPQTSSSRGPWFVIAKDIKKNALTVSHRKTPTNNIENSIPFKNANWFLNPLKADKAQIRYRGALIPGHVKDSSFITHTPLTEVPAEGQSIVFYNDDEFVGGGTIIR